jgi:hypothetical protein
MAENPEKPKLERQSLRTVSDLTKAHEWLFNAQRDGGLDSKTADALNTTLKGATYLQVKLKLDALKIFVQARTKKIEIPTYLLPEGLATVTEPDSEK